MEQAPAPDVQLVAEPVRPRLPAAEPVARAPGGGSLASFASAVGNRAMTAFVARSPVGDGASGAGPTGSPQDRGFQLERATDAEKVQEIEVRLSEGQSPVGEIWRSFGDLVATANAHGELWKRSVAKEPALAEDEDVKAEFRQKVEAIAIGHLEENRRLVVAELDALGITPNVNGKGGTVDESPEHVAEVRELQRLAGDVAKAMKAKEALLRIPVGWDTEQGRYHVQVGVVGPFQQTFEPGKPPPVGPKPKDRHMRPYAQVAEHYKVVEATLARGMAHPALFALMSHDGGMLGPGDPSQLVDQFSKASTRGASAAITNNMRRLIESIEKAARGIGSDIDYRDLVPVHDQVLRTAPFTEPYAQSVAKRDVAGHETMKTLITVGLTAVQVVSLVAASLATGGAAALLPLVGVAAGGVQAGVSIDEYNKLKTARDARTGAQEHDLVSQEQVGDAQLAAVLDTVFVFLDGIEAVAGIVKAARGGARAADEVLPKLAELRTLAPDEKETVLLAAMDSMGTGKAIEAAGGIGAAHGAGAASTRADAFAAEMESRLADHLAQHAGDAAEDLLPEAERYVAQLSGVTQGKALDTLAPRLKHRDELDKLVGKLRDTPMAAWAGLGAEERRGLVHQAAMAKYAHTGMPVPQAVFHPSMAKGHASFNPATWTVTYAQADFVGDVTHAGAAVIAGTAAHEFRHAEQTFAALRYELAKGTPPQKLRGNADAVQKAVEVHRTRPLDLSSDEGRQAEQWHREILGEGATRMNYIQGELVLLGRARKEEQAAVKTSMEKMAILQRLRAEGKEGAELQAAAEQVEAALRRREAIETRNKLRAPFFNRIYREYRELAIEADAWAAGDAATAAALAELRDVLAENFEELHAAQLALMKTGLDDLVAAGVLVAVGGGGGLMYEAVRVREAQERKPVTAP